MRRIALGIDIGGTKIRGAVLAGNRVWRVLDRKYKRKPPTAREFLEALFTLTNDLRRGIPAAKLEGIGVGTLGIIAPPGRIYDASNLPALTKLNLIRALRRRYGCPVLLMNDAKAAAWAEYRRGAGRHSRSMCMITLGTGLGGAYIKNGTIQTGAFDSAYEAGFIIVDAARARKGERGDFEWFGAEQFFKSRGLDPIEAEIKARRGDRAMRKLWQEYGEYLGIGIASLVNVLEPEIFVIGGGIAHAWPLFAPRMRKTAKRFISSPLARRKIKIVRAKLGRDAGAIGAALLISSQ